MSDRSARRGRVRDTDRPDRMLNLAADHVEKHGLADFSIRSLASALETSPRMLLYDFGSTENLLVGVINEVRTRMTARVREQLRLEPSPARAVETMWTWFTEPGQANYARFVVEVDQAVLSSTLPQDRVGSPLLTVFASLDAPEADHTLVTTVFYGLLRLHLAGQPDRANAAMRRFLGVLRTA